jgi:hypothetical protein
MEIPTYQPPKPSRIMKLFWKAAGGDSFILSQATYSDQIKYFCLGGIVVATAIMAGLSGGYAFYTIFKPSYDDVLNAYISSHNGAFSGFIEPTDMPTAAIALIFGLVWGLIIYNIDRFIVTSTGKGDGTEAITWGELKGALPRIIMGCIIAISISKPLEIRILKGEIDTQLQLKQQALKTKQETSIDAKYEAIRQKLSLEKVGFLELIKVSEDQYTESEREFQAELKEGPAGSSSNYGPDAKRKEILMNDRQKDRDRQREIYEPKINLVEKKIEDLDRQIALEKEQIKKSVAGLDGLAERITIAEENYPAVSWFLTLLFLAIELTPIFFKLMLIKSPYDYLSDNYKQLELAENGIYVDEDYYEDKEGIQRELVRYLLAEKQIEEKREFHDAQLRITKHAISKFEEREKKKIDQNPDDYISYS